MKSSLFGIITATLLAMYSGNTQAVVIADANGPYTGNEGSTINLNGSGSVGTPNPIISYEWDLDNDGSFDDATGVTVPFALFDNGVFSVGLQVTDGTDSDTATATVTVNNVTPVTNAGPDTSLDLGDLFISSGFFTDPGADTWMATVDYDAGAGPQPLALNPDKTFSLSNLYGLTGLYTGTVTVTDDDGGVGIDTFQVTVSAPVPEPATIILMGLGLAGLGFTRRRRNSV